MHIHKQGLFELFLHHLVDWFCEYYNISRVDFNLHVRNDLSKLKVIKLHFFACSTDKESLRIFDQFYAMPFGHVESDVYNFLGELNDFYIDNRKLTINDPLKPISEGEESLLIKKIVQNLKEHNKDLISLKAFDLVELSHQWFSWRYTFEEAKRLNIYSKKISPRLIEEEDKQYTLF